MSAIYKRELRAYFRSPIGFIFVGLCVLVGAIFFFVMNLRYGLASMTNFFANTGIVYIIVIPILTMRSLAEERKSRTDQLLLTAPVKTSEIVLGKFFAACTVLLVTCVIMLVFPLVLRMYGEIALGEIFVGFLGLFLMGVLFIAVGMFMSSLTESQIIAAVSTGAILLLLWFVSSFATQVSQLASSTNAFMALIGKGFYGLLNFLAVQTRFLDFAQGYLNFVPFVYFVSLTALFVYLSNRVVERRRWR